MSRRSTPALALPAEQEQMLVSKLQKLLAERFDCQLGQFEVLELVEVFAEEAAPHFYNQAISEVQAHLKDRFESIESDLWALEKS